MMDEEGNLQDEAGYLNEDVSEGDVLIEAGGTPMGEMTIMQVKQALFGPRNSVKELMFQRPDASIYTVRVRRHLAVTQRGVKARIVRERPTRMSHSAPHHSL